MITNVEKCRVLTAEGHRADIDALLEPLRRGNAVRWAVVTEMRVLGVSVVELADTTLASQAVRTALAERVVRPCNMLVEDLGAGARPSTAFWLLHRFVIPNAVFYAQIWGLLTGADVWTEVDAALDALCRTLAPADLRRRFDDSDTHALRRELALPQRLGGLGIPIFSTASVHMHEISSDQGDVFNQKQL